MVKIRPGLFSGKRVNCIFGDNKFCIIQLLANFAVNFSGEDHCRDDTDGNHLKLRVKA